MTHKDFMLNKDLIKEYNAAMSTPAVVIALSILISEYCKPILPGDRGQVETPDSCAISLGQQLGKYEAIEAVRLFASVQVNKELGKADYGTELEDDDKKTEGEI